jgi:hypothetical protein
MGLRPTQENEKSLRVNDPSSWKRHSSVRTAIEARRAGPPYVSPVRKDWDWNTQQGRAPEARHRLAYAAQLVYCATLRVTIVPGSTRWPERGF